MSDSPPGVAHPRGGVAERWRWARREQAGLDPTRDHERMAHLSLEVRLGPPLIVAALYTLGFCRQMAVPSIARVIHRGGSGDIMRETRARNDLSLNFFGRFLRSGHSSQAGRAAIAELNAIHARFPLQDHESLYTLSGLVFEGPRLTRRLGVRVLSPEEERSNYLFWAGVGARMERILPVPPQAEFWQWTLDYERENYAYSDGGSAVVEALLDDFAARLPAPVRPAGRRLLISAMDDRLRSTHRLAKPPWSDRILALGTRAFVLSKAVLPDPPDRSWADRFSAPQRAAKLGQASNQESTPLATRNA